MITTKAGVTRAIRRFEKAADAYAFKGTLVGHSDARDEYDRVVEEYEAAKKAIEEFMYYAVRQL